MHIEVGVEQRDIQVLADTRAFAMVERVADRGGAMHAGHHVADRDAGHGRSAVGLAAEHVKHARLDAPI